jgi:hypothetical protein
MASTTVNIPTIIVTFIVCAIEEPSYLFMYNSNPMKGTSNLRDWVEFSDRTLKCKTIPHNMNASPL